MMDSCCVFLDSSKISLICCLLAKCIFRRAEFQYMIVQSAAVAYLHRVFVLQFRGLNDPSYTHNIMLVLPELDFLLKWCLQRVKN